ncbi:Dos2-interacting transcription regulator of RNA-Pol-II-domain-containing protein [Xylaria intraflava]|nr:Dos2-interacting transcription regulator of RNA-Pol-II-domain-containing protein [Xylaria intraflava]
MTAASRFDGLALKYVLADPDENNQHQVISEQAAQAIEESSNKRTAVGQWVASISRWMQSSGDDDLVSRARALEFLASTLQVLSRKDDSLNADQVGLLVAFFCSLFDHDHKAGVIASARALKCLAAMKHFQPTLGSEIIESVCKLGDDFKLQAPATRLELYHLFGTFLENRTIARDLEKRHDNTCGFMLKLLDLCRSERDPENLVAWFAILSSFLQDFNPSTEVASEVFKAFSAYFPISLRPSATPTTVTTDSLKIALRSCFSAHRRISSLSIPFLVEKLDRVDQTVAVKVDILHTLDACLIKYDQPRQSIAPYADLIWGSLKYEVRNGEIQDIIKATLRVLCSLTKRLDGENLQSFLVNAWRDLKEDISDSNYTAQAGRLLVAIVGATPHSFMLLIPRALEHIKKTIKHNNSILHKRHLITLMSSVVKLRFHLASDSDFNFPQSDDGVGLLLDDLFGDSLFHDLYLLFWEEHSAASSPIEYVGILREAIHGLGALVGQKSSGKEPMRRLCSDSTCDKIFKFLAKPVIICPLEGPKYFDSIDERVPQDLLDAGEEALRNAVPLYPPSFHYLLSQYLNSVKEAYRLQTEPHDLGFRILNVSASLCAVIHSASSEPDACWLNEAALINTFLQGLQWMLSNQADPTFLAVFIDAIHMTLVQSLKQASTWDTSSTLTKELFGNLVRRFDAIDVPQVDLSRLGKVEALEFEEKGPNRPRRAYCLFVVQQLYRRFTTVSYPLASANDTPDELPTIVLREDFVTGDSKLTIGQDTFLNQLGQMATSVIRTLSEDEQKALELDREAFSLFHRQNSDAVQKPKLPSRLSSANNFRTAPLTLGIMQGLWPESIRTEVHLAALDDVIAALVAVQIPFSQLAGVAMTALLCILANKFDAKKSPVLMEHRLQTQARLSTSLIWLLGHRQNPGDAAHKLRVFRCALHYLAGDGGRLYTGEGQNPLLLLTTQAGPVDVMMGRQLAQNLGLIVLRRECLSDLNHGVCKKLSSGWVYHQTVQPNLTRCLPGPGVEEREATNRAVATFSILRHLEYAHYSSEVVQIVRIGIRSLSTFRVGVETESLLAVLLCILEKDPVELREHIAALIQGLTAIYSMARNVADAAQFEPGTVELSASKKGEEYHSKASRVNAKDRDPIATRMYTLQFFLKLAQGAYEVHLLLPHRGELLRPLAGACGDSVREIRRTALKARQAWEELD